MSQIRCILSSNESGSIEMVYFTADLESPADDFIRPDCTVSGESVLDEDDLPNCFPMEYNLLRQ